ncbi:hypothetical protein [Streptomyces silvensis]|nr:hypothetical protein [Streptomyces silvensis]
MMLRRYHQSTPDPEPDTPDTAPDSPDDAPQADKPAGRSAVRSKAKKEG